MNQKLQTLIEMHMYCRPMGSVTEQQFIQEYISNLPRAEKDQYGNWHVTVDDAPVLWSSHLDTVHKKEGIQNVKYHTRSGLLTLARGSDSSCLGADCTAGVFLMREMILAKVPGHYVFHHGEERGCVGSSKLADYQPKFLGMFQFAIALDRGGTTDVITHQSFGRTASDAFAKSLAEQLGGYFEPSDQGVYTDTNEYAALISECTNVSVGYSRQHSPAETLDTRHLFRLLAKLKKIKISKLVVDREPGDGGWDDPLDDWSRYRYLGTRDGEIIYDDDRDILRTEDVTRRDFLKAEAWARRNDALLLEEELAPYKDGDIVAEAEYLAGETDHQRLDFYLNPEYADIQRALRGIVIKMSSTRKPS